MVKDSDANPNQDYNAPAEPETNAASTTVQSFDIHRSICDKHGENDPGKIESYIDELMEIFTESPEAQPIIETAGRVGWAATMMQYSLDYLGTTPPEMSLSDFDEVVFELFPRKVSVETERAPEIVAELRAFWQFLHRHHALPTADRILESLDDDAVVRLREALGNPSNWGMAKSFVMKGTEAGFDMTTQRGCEEFMLAYNSMLLEQRQPGFLSRLFGSSSEVLSGAPDLRYFPTAGLRANSGESWRKTHRERRRTKKLQRQARKRNRR
jgi:hypothetical protein